MTKKVGLGQDTHLGGAFKDFPRTTSGFLNEICHPFGPGGKAGLEKLCERYWKPIYFFIRVGCARSNEDAKDLTQAFFAWVFESDVLAQYESRRASFRQFLKALVRGFLSDQRKAASRQKRGGNVSFVRIEDENLDLEPVLSDPKAKDPDKVFDQAWLMALMTHAVQRVRERYAGQDRQADFRIFEEYDLLETTAEPTYAELAGRLRLKESQVRDTLATVRQEVRDEIRAELARQTGSAEEFEEEWKALMGL